MAAAKKVCAGDPRLYYTVGCHPTRCNEFHAEPEVYYQSLIEEIRDVDGSAVVAIGECGLDYDRFVCPLSQSRFRENFCSREIQKAYFKWQLKLASETRLPLFLHCRNAHEDFLGLIKKHVEEFGPVIGVVHTFDGSIQHAKEVVDMGLHIGFNGCSLKTVDNLEVSPVFPLLVVV